MINDKRFILNLDISKELLSKQEVSDMTGLALKTLGQRRWRKQLPTYVLVSVSNRQPEVFYHADSVKQFIEMRQKIKDEKNKINEHKKIITELKSKRTQSLKVQDSVKHPHEDPFETLENRINELRSELEKSLEERNNKFKSYMYRKVNEFELFIYYRHVELEIKFSNYSNRTHEKLIEFENKLDELDRHQKFLTEKIEEIYDSVKLLQTKQNITPAIVTQIPSIDDILKTIPEYQKCLLIPLAGLGFSYRIYTKLDKFYSVQYKHVEGSWGRHRREIPYPLIYIGDLITQTEYQILLFPNWGRKTLNEFKEILQPYGYELGTKLPVWWKTENRKEIKELSDRYMKTRND